MFRCRLFYPTVLSLNEALYFSESPVFKSTLKLTLLFFMLFSSIASAKSEQEVVDAFFKALTSSNFSLASEQMDPTELEKFHSFFIEIAKSAEAKGKYSEFSVGPFAKYSSIK